jgi:Domain of unknown function (DUF4349)
MTMNRPRAVHLVALLVLLAAAAGAGCAERGERPSTGAASQAIQAADPASGSQMPADRAMRITIETSITVKDVDAAGRAVRDLVTQHGGYVGEARTQGDDDARSTSFEVHVPVARLPAFRAGVSGLGEVTSDDERAEDVTEQRADIKARLGNARAEEKRLLELLDKRAGTLADVVAVEKELAAVRETIERMEAQERVLEGQIASATVKIHLSTHHAAARVGPGKRILRAAGDGIDSAGSFLVGVVVVSASAGPTVLIIALMGYVLFRVVRALRRRRATKA